MKSDTDQLSSSTTSSYNIEQLSNIHPRLCILYKWSHFDGYGIHLSCNEHCRGLHIEEIEANSPAESAGLLSNDMILAVNGYSIENEDFFVILSFIQQELQKDQIRFLVIDPHGAALAQRYQLKIDENNENCIRTESFQSINNLNKITNNSNQVFIQNLSHNESNNINKFSSNSDPHDNSKSEPRICSITLRSGVDPIGISLKADTDFSHIITQVRPNSPAERAGIEPNDCIISLNNIPLLEIPFEDVIYYLAKFRNETKLEFIVAKKSYLLELSHKNSITKPINEILISSNINERNRSSTLPDIQTSEQLKIDDGDETIKDEQYDRLSLQIYSNLNIVKHKKRHGKILEGIGPATALRFSWSFTSDKTTDYASIPSDLYGRRSVKNEIKEHSNTTNDLLKTLQVGMTNPSPKSQTRRFLSQIPNTSFSDDGQRSDQSPSSIGSFHSSSNVVPNSKLSMENSHAIPTPSPLFKYNKTVQNILNIVPITPVQSSLKTRNRKQDNPQISQSNLHLATMPISEVSNHGYELHNIKLMKPTEVIPVGFKLIKQTDPFQYIMTVIVEQSKADLAGLKVNDWLIKIEDNDIRLTDLQDVLKNIYQLFNTVGFINMLIARKKSTKILDNHQMTILSSVGLSNPHQSTLKESPTNPSIDANTDKIRQITLKEPSGLYFNTLKSGNNNEGHIHSINNIQPISLAYRSGLRNNDRILTVNNIDVTNMSQEDLKSMILKTKPIELTVVKDSKYLELIESFKHNEVRKNLSSTIYETIDHKKSKDFNKIIFIDELGPVYMKHCIIKKEASYDALGFLLHYEDNFHIIHDVETDFPAYNCGIRDNDIILFINKQNIQELKHDDATALLRSLVTTNEIIDLIILKNNDLERYKDYEKNNSIDWNKILLKIYKNSTNKIQTDGKHSYVNQQSNTSPESPSPSTSSTSSLLSGARICIVEPTPNHSFGFTIESVYPPPFIISKIEKDSPAEKAGLQINDAILSINGKSVLQKSYKDTIKMIKESSKQNFVQFVVNQSLIKKESRGEFESHSSSSSNSEDYDNGESTNGSPVVYKSSHRGTDAVHEYQRQRNKELSYTLRLCHLNTTNTDGKPAPSFGFEITSDPEYEYPIISHVEPKFPGERSGLQKDDILLKLNDRKTKGVDFDKLKRRIEKAKRDGRLEMLVIDKDAFYYCIKTKKKFEEPYIKIKHIFPPSRSAVNYQSVYSISAHASSTSINRNSSCDIQHLSIQSENEENNLKSSNCQVTFDCDSPSMTPASFSHDISLKPIKTSRKLSDRRDESSIKQENSNEISTDESIINSVLNAANNPFQHIGSEKSMNLDYDIPPDRTNNLRNNAPLLPNFPKEIPPISQSHNTIHSNQSSASYDYIKDPRRCLLKIDRNKGLGFVLSANGDYDHTITSVDKNSVADVAGLQINDEIVEINGIDVRNIKYEQVVNMLISAMSTNDTIEMYVINSRVSSPIIDINKETNNQNLFNNNSNLITAKDALPVLNDNVTDKNTKSNSFERLIQQTINTSYPDLRARSKYWNNAADRRSGSVPTLSTGITASPKVFRSNPFQNSINKVMNISKKNAPIARLCRIRKFPTSPFYGFYLCGNRKKLGQVFVSNVTRHSAAAVCGLRDNDRIIEVNGTNIQTLTYETILNKIKLHMDHHDLELLVLDKKSYRWYRKRNHPITLQTLPTIVHIEPIINDTNCDILHS